MSWIEEYNYYNDPRTRAAHSTKKFNVDIKLQRLVLKPEYSEYFIERLANSRELEFGEALDLLDKAGCILEAEDPEDESPPVMVSVPVHCRYEVCDLCRGSGKVVNPSIDCGGLTREDFDQDPDFEEDYFAGRYDVTCPECQGLRVVPAWSFVENNAFSKLVAEWLEDWERDEAYSYAEMAAERRMGA